MDNNYLLSLKRLEICDLMMACTSIICSAMDEIKDPDCSEYRRDHVLPATIKKWQQLHDKVVKQLEKQDALYI